MDKVFIKNLRIQCILGVYDWERETPREVIVNVELGTDTGPASRSDNLADCVDYDQLSQQIRALAERARRLTVEALAEDIANLCLSISQVREAMVRVEKPGAVMGADSVGVEIIRKKN
jgi:FolB domain-containing protein